MKIGDRNLSTHQALIAQIYADHSNAQISIALPKIIMHIQTEISWKMLNLPVIHLLLKLGWY